MSPQALFVDNKNATKKLVQNPCLMGPRRLLFRLKTSKIVNTYETDRFSFNQAFKYYRECVGLEDNFKWNNKYYSTLLIDEVPIIIIGFFAL